MQQNNNNNNQQQQQNQNQQQQRPRGQGTSATNDQYGMLGFNQQEVQNQIFRPVDLNSLGIAVSSADQLHLTFGSPWQDNHNLPGSRLQPEFRIPECYYVTAPVIKYALFQKLHLETLFYIFYSMPRDVLQVAAAKELNSRDWRYHKQLQQWISRAPGAPEPKPVPGYPKGTAERGTYQVWSVERWTLERLENHTLNLQDLEDINAQQQQQQQQQQNQQQQQQNNQQQNQQQQQQQHQGPPGSQVAHGGRN